MRNDSAKHLKARPGPVRMNRVSGELLELGRSQSRYRIGSALQLAMKPNGEALCARVINRPQTAHHSRDASGEERVRETLATLTRRYRANMSTTSRQHNETRSRETEAENVAREEISRAASV